MNQLGLIFLAVVGGNLLCILGIAGILIYLDHIRKELKGK